MSRVMAWGLATGLLVLAGCERQPPPPAVPPATPAGVTTEQAAAATYPTEVAADGTLTLRDGRYADADLVEATLEDEMAGDLDGDGVPERAVVLATSTGGSGIFRDLYVLRRAGDALQVSAPAALGDRVVVRGLRIERGEVVVDLLVQGETDPLCCPTLPVSYRFRPVGDELQETSGTRRVHLKQ